MLNRIIMAVVGCVFLLILAACETVEPQPQFMSEVAFSQELRLAKSLRPPSAADARITRLMDDHLLTVDMQARALFERGSLRRLNRINVRGGLADFDRLLQIAPAHPLAGNARIERQYLQTDIQRIESLSRTGRLQTLAQWFDDAWQLGDRDAAARRYQSSGLSPTRNQVQKLVQAGYICRTGAAGNDVYRYGDRRSDLNNLKWCSAL